ncbi:MAG: alpha/beta hydrolase [Actinomycetota bacterium]|nr:alpha/beta hydrolase [Actinomycetota bacterium]
MSVRPQLRVHQAAAACVAALLTVAACSDAGSLREEPAESGTTQTTGPPETSAPTLDAAALDDYYEQEVEWTDCTGGECGSALVPLDYAEPTGETVTLALKRIPATGEPVGTLFVNPGGPGGSGVEFADTFVTQMRPQVLRSYDVVGFDPRGVGRSDPVDCLGDAELGDFLAADADPETPEEIAQVQDAVDEFGQGCVASTGDLLAHVSTIEVARDLDVLRGVVGDEQLTYYGASYGTSIGSAYAELFPEHAGRLVLDGATDPSLSSQERNLTQAAGFQTALYAYVENCQLSPDCPLPPGRDEAARRVGDLLDQLDAAPLPTGDPERPLTESLGFYGIGGMLYNQANWAVLTPALERAFAGDGAELLRLSDFYFSREDDGSFTDNSAEAILAVNCLDDPSSSSVEEVEASIPAYTEASPTFGRLFAWSQISCADWPVESSYEPREIRAKGAEPILVIGTTRDPATPYEWSVALAEQLESGVLVSRDGDGHTSFGADNACVDSAIDAFFLDGTVPDDGLEC